MDGAVPKKPKKPKKPVLSPVCTVENSNFNHNLSESRTIDNEIYKNNGGSSSSTSSSASSSSSSFKLSYSVNSQSDYAFLMKIRDQYGQPLTKFDSIRYFFEIMKSDENGAKRFQKAALFKHADVASEDEVEEIPEHESVPQKVPSAPSSTNKSSKIRRVKVKKFEIERRAAHEHAVKLSRTKKLNIDGDLGSADMAANSVVKYNFTGLPLSTLNLDTTENEVHNNIESSPHGSTDANICDNLAVDKRIKNEPIYAKINGDDDSIDYDAVSASDSFDSEFDPNDVIAQQTNIVPEIHVFNENNCIDKSPNLCKENVSNPLVELIETERSYVNFLKNGMKNYMPIFDKKNLPLGLQGKKYAVFGNITQIFSFHDEIFLPMLEKNKDNFVKLLEEFCEFIKNDEFYIYVLYAINKKKSDQLCLAYRQYFAEAQKSIDDRLGLNSFLVQPIQRLPRYRLLLNRILAYNQKHEIASPICETVCSLLSDVLETVNHSTKISEILDCYDINLLHQGLFRRCDEFVVYEYAIRRRYRSEVFMFDKVIVYTEYDKDDKMKYRGHYPSNKIGYIPKSKGFKLFYERQGVQQCYFNAKPEIIDIWVDYIAAMINNFIVEEKKRLSLLYRKSDDEQRRSCSTNVLQIRHNSFRYSSDSGRGTLSPRTTWYTDAEDLNI